MWGRAIRTMTGASGSRRRAQIRHVTAPGAGGRVAAGAQTPGDAAGAMRPNPRRMPMFPRSLIHVLSAAVLAVTLPLGAALPQAAAAMPQAQVNDSLRGESSIYNALFTAALIHHVVQVCDELRGPNRLERVAFFLPLYREARSMGFSRDQIENFVNDEAEKALMQTLVDRHLQAQGVDPKDVPAVCAFGRQQIEERTPIGRRLSER